MNYFFKPVPADLAPFRAGSVWRWESQAFIAVTMELIERVRFDQKRTLGGQVFDAKVFTEAPARVRLQMDRAEAFDPVGDAPDLAGLGSWGLFRFSGQAWRLVMVEQARVLPSGILTFELPGDAATMSITAEWQRDPTADEEPT